MTFQIKKSLLIITLATGCAATAHAATLSYKGVSFPTATLQPTFVYAAKFVCGTQGIASVGIGRTVNYSSVTPGNYATSLDILSLNQTAPDIQVKIVTSDPGVSGALGPIAAGNALTLNNITCDDILTTLQLPAAIKAYEGHLVIERYQADLDLKAVYTYAAREKFAEWQGVDYNGNVMINPEIGVYSIGGAGGVGVGVSVDVERIIPFNRRTSTSQ